MKRRCAIAILAACGLTAARADDADYVVVKAARVITVSGEDYAPGTIVIENGKISLVGGAKIEYPAGAKIIRAESETVLPGLIHPHSRYGLAAYKRNGVNGDWFAADEIYPDAIDFEHARAAGYTAICFKPDGQGINGHAATMRTAGPEEERLLTNKAYLSADLNWSAKGKATLRDALKKAKDEIEKVEKAREEWEKKQADKKAKEEAEKKKQEKEQPEDGKDKPKSASDEPKPEDKPVEDPENGRKKEEDKFTPPDIDPKHKPLVDLLRKEEGAAPLMILLSRAADLHHLDDVLELHDELTAGLFLNTRRYSDFHHVVEKLGEREALVVLRPEINYEPYTTFRYNLMADLAAAGCRVAAVPVTDSRLALQYVRTRLAALVRAGLPEKEALKALTQHAAEAAGVGDRLGTLEKDKDADLAFFDGDPLDPHSQATRIMIAGKIAWEKEDPK